MSTRHGKMQMRMEGNLLHDGITVGTVVNTDDPQQMGRVKVVCPAYNDKFDSDVPWATYVSPFGGTFTKGTTGPNDTEVNGPMTYGMWAIPKLGAQVLVMCIDGNPNFRVWMGCLFGQNLPHTMPHGRYFFPEGSTNSNQPLGPGTTIESPLQPLYDSFKTAFFDDSLIVNYEWMTRGADFSLAAVGEEDIDKENFVTEVADSIDITYQGTEYRQGYAKSRMHDDIHRKFGQTEGPYYDSQVYSITTPGFHAISMDDRKENGRMRFRSTTGHQIILDDTNERIYISTAEGRNWVELDRAGNIDIHTDNKVSIHAAKDINLTADESIRMYAKNIHMTATEEIRAKGNTGAHLISGAQLFLTSTGNTNILASGDIIETGTQIHMNGPSASAGTSPYFTNRIPQHEPWARTMTANDTTHDPEFTYTDPNVGKIERGALIGGVERGPNWRR